MGWDGHWYTGVGWWEVRKVRTIPSCSGKAQWKLSKPSQPMFFQSAVYLLNPWPRMASHVSYGWHGILPRRRSARYTSSATFCWSTLACWVPDERLDATRGSDAWSGFWGKSTAVWWNQTDSRGMSRGFVEGYWVYSSCGGIELS